MAGEKAEQSPIVNSWFWCHGRMAELVKVANKWVPTGSIRLAMRSWMAKEFGLDLARIIELVGNPTKLLNYRGDLRPWRSGPDAVAESFRQDRS